MPDCTCIHQAGKGDGCDDAQEKGKPTLCEPGPEIVPGSRAKKSADDLRQSAAQQKCKSAAGKGGGKSKLPGLIKTSLICKPVEHGVDLPGRAAQILLGKIPDEALQTVEHICVDTGTFYAKGL